MYFVSDDVLIVILSLVEYISIMWSYNTVQVKSETSALPLVPCFTEAGHKCFYQKNLGLSAKKQHVFQLNEHFASTWF